MPNPNWTEIISTTLEHRNMEFADNVSNGNVVLAKLNMGGKVKMIGGGRVIVEELEYGENSTFQFYTGYELLNIDPSDVFTAAEFDWKQASVNVSASGLEVDIQNAGKEQVIPLLESRIGNAKRTARNNMSTAVYSDGTSFAGKQVGGLKHIVADAPTTGTVGGIDRSDAANEFWRNQTSGDVAFVGANPDPSDVLDQATLRQEMQDMWLETKRGNDKVDLITADKAMFSTFWSSLTEIQRVSSSERAVAGFNSIAFVTSDVVYDGDSGIADNHMYYLNTEFIYLKVKSGRNWQPKARKESVNQDAFVVPLFWAGNLTCSNAARQGVIFT